MGKTKLRDYARCKPCQVRIPGVCTHDRDTTVLAHKNGGKSNSSKNPDLLAAWCCAECHDHYDGRRHQYLKDETQRLLVNDWFLEGILRTQQELLKTANRHGVTLAEAIEKWARGLET